MDFTLDVDDILSGIAIKPITEEEKKFDKPVSVIIYLFQNKIKQKTKTK